MRTTLVVPQHVFTKARENGFKTALLSHWPQHVKVGEPCLLKCQTGRWAVLLIVKWITRIGKSAGTQLTFLPIEGEKVRDLWVTEVGP